MLDPKDVRDLAALARDLGFTPIYLRYNSGRHVSENGRDLAALLERLEAEWPAPIEELAIVGYSMGGLVARSACHAGEAASHGWRDRLRTLVCLGTPHHGSPLERWGNLVDRLLGVSRYSAPFARLGKIRRRDGRRQLTLAGKPLYYYVGDRKPLQVLCQNVREFGGLWLVVNPSGDAVS